MMKNATKNICCKASRCEPAQALIELSATELDRVSGGRLRPGLSGVAARTIRHTAPPAGVRRRIDGRYLVQVQ